MTANHLEPGSAGQAGTSAANPKRINVAVNADTVAALQNVIQQEGVSLTEAVRRLIGYGDFVYRSVRQENADVLVRGKDGDTKQVVLV